MSDENLIPGTDLPDQMTGEDLVKQETHEEKYDENYFNGLDRVDRRDKRGEITSFVANKKYLEGYDMINWGICENCES